MRHVNAADLQANAVELTEAIAAGDEVVLTLNGRAFRLVAENDARIDRRTPEQRVQQREAVAAAYALGQSIKARSGATSAEEIRGWIEESRP